MDADGLGLGPAQNGEQQGGQDGDDGDDDQQFDERKAGSNRIWRELFQSVRTVSAGNSLPAEVSDFAAPAKIQESLDRCYR